MLIARVALRIIAKLIVSVMPAALLADVLMSPPRVSGFPAGASVKLWPAVVFVKLMPAKLVFAVRLFVDVVLLLPANVSESPAAGAPVLLQFEAWFQLALPAEPTQVLLAANAEELASVRTPAASNKGRMGIAFLDFIGDDSDLRLGLRY